MIHRREARDTLHALEIMHGDVIDFGMGGGERVGIELISTGAEIVDTTLREPGVEEPGGRTVYRFRAEVRVNGEAHRLEREVGTQASFYEPWEIGPVRIWLDAVDAIFAFMNETHAPCRLQENCSHHLPPRRHARFAIQARDRRICPDRVHPWCPLPAGGLRIEDCYRGEDCWLGAYDGASAHGGLDINHPAGTPLFAPIDLDDQFLYNSTDTGYNNNRWRGVRRWADGSTWVLGSSHMVRLTAPERQALRAGQQYAEGAGVWVGAAEHSHFAFAIFDQGELIRLDPWILFRQMYEDGEAK